MTDLEQLGVLVAEREQTWLASRSGHAGERDRFLAAFRAQQRQTATKGKRLFWLAAAISFAGAALLAVWISWPATLSAHTEGPATRTLEAADLFTAEARAQHVRFSDGSRVTLAKGGVARVKSLQALSADLEVLSGTLSLNVLHRPGQSWVVRAGPYRVRVVGTRFEVSWQQVSKQFTLSVSEGAVRVSGGDLGKERGVNAGQSLTLPVPAAHDANESARAALALAGRAPRTDSQRGPESPSPAANVRAPATNARETVPLPDVSARQQSWVERARAGDYRAAYPLAQAAGFEHLSNTAPSEQLLVLADVARYSGHHEQARGPLLALRRRFAGSKEAATAAFQLGRLSGNSQQAIEHFKAYLAEQPNGALAREASGRLMELLSRLGEPAAARSEAVRYLKRYPHGPHAAFARSLLDH